MKSIHTSSDYEHKLSSLFKKTPKKIDKNLLFISENLTDNTKSINNILNEDVNKSKNYSKIKKSKNINSNSILNDNNSYLSQFETQTFDCTGSPSAMNDLYKTNDKFKLADLERQLSYKNGWSDINNSTTYNIFADNELTHNNMIPHFDRKFKYGTNDLLNEHVMDYKNELFTGNIKSWKNKKENKPLFKPVANLIHAYGMPIRSDEELERYIPSRYHQNEKPIEPIKVAPIINSTFRIMPKTVDELRIKPKITYEGRIINGMKGQKRPIQAVVNSYRPETFKINSQDDLLPNTDINMAPKVKENYILKDTDRIKQHFEYTGGAYTSDTSIGKNVPEYMREKYKYAHKQNFILPEPLQKLAREELIYNPNHESYDIPFNNKSQTCENNYLSSLTNKNNIYTNITNINEPTLKEITMSEQKNTNILPNTMRGTVQHIDIANPTLREITQENKLNPHIDFHTQQRVYHSDEINPTIKETTIETIEPTNFYQDKNIYAQLGDNFKTTLKEETTQIPYQTIITPLNNKLNTSQHQDAVRTTLKENIVQLPLQKQLSNINNKLIIGHQDIPKNTLKENITNIPYQTILNPIIKHGQCNYQDSAKETLKEETIQIPYQSMLTPINNKLGKIHDQNEIKTTLKEEIIQIPYKSTITPLNNFGKTHIQDQIKTTLKEDIIEIPYQSIVTPINQTKYQNHNQDIAKTTMKENTNEIQRQTNIYPINKYTTVPLQDVAKSTIKEETIQIPYQSIISPINKQIHTPYQDINKTTLKETIKIPYQTVISPINIQSTTPYQDIAKTTQKEQISQIPNKTIISSTNMQISVPYQDIGKSTLKEAIDNNYQTPINITNNNTKVYNQDISKTTIKESMVENPYNTLTTGINQIQSAMASFNYKPLKTTLKEEIVENTNNTLTTGINQIQGKASSFNHIPLSNTIKETNINNNYINYPNYNINSKGYGYISEKMFAPNTNRQFTSQEVYITPVKGNLRERKNDDIHNARINETKELLHQYRSPTNSGENKGPIKENINAQFKNDNNKSNKVFVGYSFNNQQDRVQSNNICKIPNKKISTDLIIDPSIIEQLDKNPFNIKYNPYDK